MGDSMRSPYHHGKIEMHISNVKRQDAMDFLLEVWTMLKASPVRDDLVSSSYADIFQYEKEKLKNG